MASWMAMFKRKRTYDHLHPAVEMYHTLSESLAGHNKQAHLQEIDTDSNFNPSSTDPHFAWQSGSLDKLLLLGASVLPLIASTYLLVENVTDKRSTGPLLDFVPNNRATAQIVVSIVSALLATLNVYVMTQLLTFATRIHLLGRSLTPAMFKFIEAVAKRRMVSGVSAAMCTTSLILVVLFAVPNVLWTGALTPILTNSTILETGVLKIPQYSPSSNATWSMNSRLWATECTTMTNKKGVFSDCPVDVLHSKLLSRAAQVTSNLTQVRSKNDNSPYAYVSRSYGVGSSAGLVDENLYASHSSANLLSYNYTEPGYLTNVSCFHNTSSDWKLKEIRAGEPQNGIPYIYYAIGYFPNAEPGSSIDFFSVVGLNGNAHIAVLAAKSAQGRNIIVIAAGSDYPILNRMQCDVTFTPTLFAVGVDVATKLIKVHPNTTAAAAGPPSFDPTSGLATTVILQLNGLGMISTSLYTSIVGDSLMSNIRAATTSAATTSPATIAAAMADSFAAMLDDLLLFVGSSQFFVPTSESGEGDFSTVDAQLNVQAIRLGDAKYVHATFGLCVALLLAVGIEATRTKTWKRLPKWDFTDTMCLMLASAVAGQDLVRGMWRGGEGRTVEWTGGGNWKGRRNGTEVPVRLSLGRKVVKLSTSQARDGGGDEDGIARAAEEEEVPISAVSLWTSSAKDVVPLV